MVDTVLLPYQRKWIADKSQLKIAEKSRRTGLTWAEASDAVLTAAASKVAGGHDHFYVGSGKDMAIEFIDACAMWAKAFDKACSNIVEEEIFDEDQDKSILTYVIRFASGFKIQALSSSPSNLRGRQGSVTIDEAAFHDRLAEVLKSALALTMWGAKVRLISTHNGYENLFNQIITDSRAGKKRYSVHRLTLDDACEDGLYKRICQVKNRQWSQAEEDQWKQDLLNDTATKEDALEEYYCVPKHGSGSYLSRMLLESCKAEVPIFRFTGSTEFNAWPEHLRHAEMQDWCNTHLTPVLATLNPALEHTFGEDFARVSDLTVMAPMAIAQNLARSVPFLVELSNTPYKQQEQVLSHICDRLPRLRGGALDNRGNGGYLAEQAAYRYGSNMHKVELSQKWYLENMPAFKAAFEDRNITIPADADVVSDLLAIKVIKGIAKVPDVNTSTTKGKNRHGDAAIAIALAFFASMADVIEYDYEAIASDPNKSNNSNSQDLDDLHQGRFSTRGVL